MYTNYYSNINQQPRSMLQQIGLKGRPVSSLEEARATSIDFDGSIFYFPDIANQKIYTKQINLDGTATLNMYELKEFPIDPPTINSSQFVTREEFEKVVAQLDSLIKSTAPVEPIISTPQSTTNPNYKF